MHGNDRIRPYLDPQLVRDPKVYAQFLLRLDAVGILTWKTGIRPWLRVFFVAKKSGKLRIILDTRDVKRCLCTAALHRFAYSCPPHYYRDKTQ